MRRLGWILAVCLSATVVMSCSKQEKPRSRPATRMYDRSMAQLGMVDLVVKDKARAHAARRILEDLEDAFRDMDRTRAAASAEAFGQTGEPTDKHVRDLFAIADLHYRKGLHQYAVSQVALRKTLTPEEFRRLSELR